MRDYCVTLAEIEERLAKLHSAAAEQIERIQSAAPHAFEDGEQLDS